MAPLLPPTYQWHIYTIISCFVSAGIYTNLCFTPCKHFNAVFITCALNLILDLFQELGLIRKPASFMTSICDERGQELIYAGMPITEVFKEEMGLGGVLGLLWFQRRLV